jgi:hypothetical protein
VDIGDENTEIWRDFSELLKLFLDHRVEFTVVGAHALAAHGAPRLTGDLDLFVRPSAENAGRVLAALADFGFATLEIGLDDLTNPHSVIQLGVPPGRIDLLSGISGVSFDEVWSNRVVAELGGLRVPVIGRAELVRNKRASARQKDLYDLETLGEGEERSRKTRL